MVTVIIQMYGVSQEGIKTVGKDTVLQNSGKKVSFANLHRSIGRQSFRHLRGWGWRQTPLKRIS
jgi:hypothetical protein